MTHPLVLGTKFFPVNLIQGPLAGISCAPFRELVWQYSQPAFSCTEMISCKTIIHQPKMHARFLKKSNMEGPVCFQLSGNDALELAEAVKKVTDCGADLIDLNCGCPVNKIRSIGAGSSLLSDAKHLYKLMRAMKTSTSVPVSIKIRVDGGSFDQYNMDLVAAIQDADIDFVIVHGRHWTEHYETPCRYEQIKFFVDALSIPVIGNGDVMCLDSLKKMMATGCAGAMIGRAGVGQPWLIGKLIAESQNTSFTSLAQAEIGEVFIRHVQSLAMLLNNEKFAVLQARKFAKYYARNLLSRSEFCNEVYVCETLKSLEKTVKFYF